MDVYLRAFGARLFSQCLDLRRFANISVGADSVIYRCEFGRQMRGDKKCPLNDGMSKGSLEDGCRKARTGVRLGL